MTKQMSFVLGAVQQGMSDENAIPSWLGLSMKEVRTSLRELEAEHLIRRDGEGWKAVGGAR